MREERVCYIDQTEEALKDLRRQKEAVLKAIEGATAQKKDTTELWRKEGEISGQIEFLMTHGIKGEKAAYDHAGTVWSATVAVGKTQVVPGRGGHL